MGLSASPSISRIKGFYPGSKFSMLTTSNLKFEGSTSVGLNVKVKNSYPFGTIVPVFGVIIKNPGSN